MKICYVLNDIQTEKAGSSVRLIKKTHERGHQVYVCAVGGFNFHHDRPISIDAVKVSSRLKPSSPEKMLEYLKEKDAEKEQISSTDLDVLFIRNNPTEEDGRVWAERAGVAFGRMIQQLDVLVLNDAYALSHAFIDKLYFEELPQEIKPNSIVTRNPSDIMDFYESVGKKMVLKPLEGSGGQNVFLIDEHEKNLNQIIETLLAEGYVIAQEFLPEVSKGDVRVLLMNGRVLEEDGKAAVIRRVAGEGEFRSNFALGATADNSEITEDMQKIIDITAPKLIRDGLFFVGLDIVDDKLIEINVLSPGGLERFEDIGLPDFTETIVKAIERKLDYKKAYPKTIRNRTLATMH